MFMKGDIIMFKKREYYQSAHETEMKMLVAILQNYACRWYVRRKTPYEYIVIYECDFIHWLLIKRCIKKIKNFKTMVVSIEAGLN